MQALRGTHVRTLKYGSEFEDNVCEVRIEIIQRLRYDAEKENRIGQSERVRVRMISKVIVKVIMKVLVTDSDSV